MQKTQRSELLGTSPMRTLVPKISIPVMVSMLVQALYNVVDSIFVSRYNPMALTAVSLAYPIQMLMIALSVGMGTGISSLMSRKLGERNPEKARQAAWNGMIIELCSACLFLIIGLFLARPAMHLLVSQNLENAEDIRSMSITYLRIVTCFCPGLFMSILFERMLQSTGNTVLSMITQLTGAVTNIVLDPILIFGYLGAPQLGIAGAAIATVIGQWCSALLGFVLNQKRNTELVLRVKDFQPSAQLLRDILAVGFPSTIMQAIGSVMNVGMNSLLSTYPEGNAAVNVLNVYFKLQSFVFMPVFGLSTGIIAIVGYNFGARNRKRVYEAIRVGLTYALCIMIVGMIIFLAFPTQLMSLFESSGAGEIAQATTRIGVSALRIISLSFLMAAVGIILSSVYQAVGKGTYSLIMSLCRQLLVLLPVAWLFTRLFMDVHLIWWAFPISEAVSCVICLFLFRKLNRDMLSKL